MGRLAQSEVAFRTDTQLFLTTTCDTSEPEKPQVGVPDR